MGGLVGWDAAAQAQLAGGAIRAGIFFRMSSGDDNQPIRIWAGDGAFEYGPDLVETDTDATYLGFGQLLELDQLSALINGVAERVDFKMSGAWMSASIAELFAYHADEIRQAQVDLGFLILDATGAPISPMAWLWDGTADSITVERANAGSASEPQIIRAITLSVGSLFTEQPPADPGAVDAVDPETPKKARATGL